MLYIVLIHHRTLNLTFQKLPVKNEMFTFVSIKLYESLIKTNYFVVNMQNPPFFAHYRI